MSVALVWSAVPALLTGHHGQLAAGTVGGLVLLLLRVIPTYHNDVSSGKTPMSIVMVSSLGMLLLTVSVYHPALWSGLGVVTMISGVASWLWYPPASFNPFRSSAHAIIALAFAICIPAYLEAIDYSPWVSGTLGRFPWATGNFIHPRILGTALSSVSLGLLVISWPLRQISLRTRILARLSLAVVLVTTILFALPMTIWAVLCIVASALMGVVYQRYAHARFDGDHVGLRRRSAFSSIAMIGLLLVSFCTPPLFAKFKHDDATSHEINEEIDAKTALHASPAFRLLVPRARTSSSELSKEIANAEWKAAWGTLPFGAGSGTHLDETIRRLPPSILNASSDVYPTLFNWHGPPHSMLAAMVIEHGIIAGFIWALMAFGGMLLAFLVIRNSTFPAAIVGVVGLSPALTIAFLRGGSQTVPMFAVLLAWFLLCAPLANAEERKAQRLVPAPSVPSDQRKAPRGRILILLIPAAIAAWFAIADARASTQTYHAYQALDRHDTVMALTRFHHANTIFSTPENLYNEAILLHQRHGAQAASHIDRLLDKAIHYRPHAVQFLTARAAWRLEQSGLVDKNEAEPLLIQAQHDIDRAYALMPDWSTVQELRDDIVRQRSKLQDDQRDQGPRRIQRR